MHTSPADSRLPGSAAREHTAKTPGDLVLAAVSLPYCTRTDIFDMVNLVIGNRLTFYHLYADSSDL